MPNGATERGLFTSGMRLLGLPIGEGLRFWEILSIFGFALGLLFIGFYGHAVHKFWAVFGVLALVGTAAWLAGSVLGFLFGVPRLRATQSQTGAPTSAFIPNTNLEQISDWLTKIIVGATLVQLGPLVGRVNDLAAAIGAAVGTPGSAAASGAVMILYFAGGFMWGYLWCSLRIFREMSALVDREQAVSLREAGH